MKKQTMVVVELDENYLMPVEMKLAFAVDEIAEIEFISTMEAYEKYFSKLHNIDILVIDETVYTQELHRNNIKRTYILTEKPEIEDTGSTTVIKLYKYANVNSLVKAILPEEWICEEGGKSKGKIVAVISPSGGSGCTTVAIGIGAFLAGKQRNVLYINSQQMQNFQYYLNNRETLSIEASVKLNKETDLYQNMKEFFCREYFDYLPELSSARSNLDVSMNAYSQLVSEAAESQDYDFVITDIGTELSTDALEIFEKADKILVIVNQDAYSEYKVSVLDRFLNYDDSEHFMFICNKYIPEESNCFDITAMYNRTNRVRINEYIDKINEPLTIERLSMSEGIQKVGMTMF